MPTWTGNSLAGKYQATPATLTDGTQTQLLTDNKGAVVLGAGSNTVGTVNVAGTVPVSGTFWQTTQPVSLASLPVLPAGTNAIGSVTVSNLPATQAVSGTVNVGNFPATQAVTGTFWQATQPVSLASLPTLPAGTNTIGALKLTDGTNTASVDASGNQKVTLTTAIPAGANAIGSVSVSNLPATQAVSGTVSVGNFPATQAVSLASLPALAAGTNTIGSVKLTDGANTATINANGSVSTAPQAAVTSYSTAALAAGATYTSPTFDTINGQSFLSYSAFSVTDLAVIFDESNDGTNWYAVDTYAVAAGESNYSNHRISARYGRVRVVNGTVGNAGGISNLAIACKLDATGAEGDVQIADKFGTIITADKSWGLRVKTAEDTDAFGASIAHGRYTQISANFSQALNYNDLTTTVSGGATITQANGSATIASGTATTAAATLQSNAVISYTPGHEIFSLFTAAFTAPTSAASYQRIGLFDASNGFFIGYNGTSFGITWRQGGVDTFIPQASFNEDTLTGSINSFFTSNQSAVVFDPTKKNIFRIRFGWLGSAPVRFEILSPDGRWVRFHVIRYPNTAVAPHLYNPNLPVTAEVNKTASDATNLQISTSSWDAGVVDSTDSDLSYTGTISAANGAVTSNAAQKGTVSINITGTWVGTLVIEGHNGDLQWVQVSGYTASGGTVTSITNNQFVYINSSAFSQVRVRASAWTSGTATVQTNATGTINAVLAQVGGIAKTTQPAAALDGQRANILTDKLGRVVVAPGHVRDLVTNQYTQLTNTTETTIVTAVAATYLDITSLIITNASNQAVNVTLRDATAGTTRAVLNLAANGGVVFNPPAPLKQAAVNSNWTAQLSATATVNITAIAVQNI